MVNLEALFKITHGMYITGATDESGRFVGSCIDSVMVAEAVPTQILISMNKQSYTRESVLKTGKIALSVLPQNAPIGLIKKFGFLSSRNTNKWADTPHEIIDGLPVLKEAVSIIIAEVISSQETANHTLFLCAVNEIIVGTMAEPMTYAYYQKYLQPQTKKENNMSQEKPKTQWVCTICGYVYDGDIPFEELPDDYLCPVCAQPKAVFVEEEI